MSQFTKDEFKAIEDAVMETERGRRFLTQYAHNARKADTDILLKSMSKLENLVKSNQPAHSVNSALESTAMLQLIDDTCTDMSAIHNSLIDEQHQAEPSEDIFTNTAAINKALAEEIMDVANLLQQEADDAATKSSADTEGNTEENTEDAPAICQRAQFSDLISQWGWVLDVTAQRMAKTAELMNCLRQELHRDATSKAAPPALAQSINSGDMKYFSDNEDLFTADNGAEITTNISPTRTVIKKVTKKVTKKNADADQDKETTLKPLKMDMSEKDRQRIVVIKNTTARPPLPVADLAPTEITKNTTTDAPA